MLGHRWLIPLSVQQALRTGNIPTTAPYPINYLSGFQCASAADTLHDVTIAAGYCRDGADGADHDQTSSITKQFDVTFAEGTNAGGMASGESLPASGTIHLWSIRKDDGTHDVFANDHATSGLTPTLPTGFTSKRRILSLPTDGTNDIIPFDQFGDWVTPRVPQSEVNTSNPGTSAVTVTLTVPTGIEVIASIALTADNSASNPDILVTALDQTDTTPSATALSVRVSGSNAFSGAVMDVKTNTSGQIRYRFSASGAGDDIIIVLHKWMDLRGRDG